MFALQPSFLRRLRGLCPFADFGPLGCLADQIHQAGTKILAFLFLGAEPPSIDDKPSWVIRFPAKWVRRSRMSSGKEGEWATSERTCTAVATLLTFCPPGPEARMNCCLMEATTTNTAKKGAALWRKVGSVEPAAET